MILLTPASTTSVTYPHAILGTIYLVVQEKSKSNDPDLPSYIDTLIPTLLNKIIIPATIPGPKTRILCSPEVMHVVSLITNTIVRSADVSAQNAFYTELFKLFLTGEPTSLISSNQEAVRKAFRPLDSDTEGSQVETVQIFVAAVAAARKVVYIQLFRSLLMKAVLPVPDINHFLLQAAEIAVIREDPRGQHLLKLIACVLNKQSNDNHITTLVDLVVNDMWLSKVEHDRRKENIELLAWVTPFHCPD